MDCARTIGRTHTDRIFVKLLFYVTFECQPECGHRWWELWQDCHNQIRIHASIEKTRSCIKTDLFESKSTILSHSEQSVAQFRRKTIWKCFNGLGYFILGKFRVKKTFKICGKPFKMLKLLCCFFQWPNENDLYPALDSTMGQLLNALRNEEIILARNAPKGTQLKLLLYLAGKQKVIFKPNGTNATKLSMGQCIRVKIDLMPKLLDFIWVPY